MNESIQLIFGVIQRMQSLEAAQKIQRYSLQPVTVIGTSTTKHVERSYIWLIFLLKTELISHEIWFSSGVVKFDIRRNLESFTWIFHSQEVVLSDLKGKLRNYESSFTAGCVCEQLHLSFTNVSCGLIVFASLLGFVALLCGICSSPLEIR